jgi:hypothetical protein
LAATGRSGTRTPGVTAMVSRSDWLPSELIYPIHPIIPQKTIQIQSTLFLDRIPGRPSAGDRIIVPVAVVVDPQPVGVPGRGCAGIIAEEAHEARNSIRLVHYRAGRRRSRSKSFSESGGVERWALWVAESEICPIFAPGPLQGGHNRNPHPRHHRTDVQGPPSRASAWVNRAAVLRLARAGTVTVAGGQS